jgi:hypothetical protein
MMPGSSQPHEDRSAGPKWRGGDAEGSTEVFHPRGASGVIQITSRIELEVISDAGGCQHAALMFQSWGDPPAVGIVEDPPAHFRVPSLSARGSDSGHYGGMVDRKSRGHSRRSRVGSVAWGTSFPRWHTSHSFASRAGKNIGTLTKAVYLGGVCHAWTATSTPSLSRRARAGRQRDRLSSRGRRRVSGCAAGVADPRGHST